MCVIAVQNKKQKELTYDEIMAMCSHNPDGFGIMWNDGITCHYKKGYFNADDFYDDYVEIKENKRTNNVALHMRIATGSNVDIANCHPFPITSLKKRLKKSKGTCDVAIMMNGIIGESTKELSDTALYVMKNLKPWYDKDCRFYNHFTKRQLRMFENEIHGCRFAFMDKKDSKLFGNGWSNYDDKAMVSNRYWIPVSYNNYLNFEKYYGGMYNYHDSYYNDLPWDSDEDDYLPWIDKPTKATRFATKTGKRHKSYIDYLEEGTL